MVSNGDCDGCSGCSGSGGELVPGCGAIISCCEIIASVVGNGLKELNGGWIVA